MLYFGTNIEKGQIKKFNKINAQILRYKHNKLKWHTAIKYIHTYSHTNTLVIRHLLTHRKMHLSLFMVLQYTSTVVVVVVVQPGDK